MKLVVVLPWKDSKCLHDKDHRDFSYMMMTKLMVSNVDKFFNQFLISVFYVITSMTIIGGKF